MQSTVPDEQNKIEEMMLMYVQLQINCILTTGNFFKFYFKTSEVGDKFVM
jgi:hypothetical protein